MLYCKSNNINELHDYVNDYARFMDAHETKDLGPYSREHAERVARAIDQWCEEDGVEWFDDMLGDDYFELFGDGDLADLVHVNMLRHGGCNVRSLLGKAMDGIMEWWRRDDRPNWMDDEYMHGQVREVMFLVHVS